MKIESWFEFRIDNADTQIDLEHHTVSGTFISEEPNNLDQIFDYATSKPLIAKWSRHFQEVTNGTSFGNVRAMHGSDAIGIITVLKFDDKGKRVYGTAHITDDDEWKKVVEKVYTGFSMGGDSKGALWKDKIATAKYGRLIKRYTFVPRELSLCDKGRIPGTEFTEIHNADTQEDHMPDPTEDKGQRIDNGITTSNELGQLFANLAATIKWIEIEEHMEGEGDDLVNKFRAALKPFAEVVKEYQAAQVDEIVSTGEDTDDADEFAPDDDEVEECDNADKPKEGDKKTVENGDLPGHVFHGNQHAEGKDSGKGSKAQKESAKASKTAYHASIAAHSSQSMKDHNAAAGAHKEAAKAAENAGRTKLAAYHNAQADHHTAMAKMQNADVDKEAERKAKEEEMVGKGKDKTKEEADLGTVGTVGKKGPEQNGDKPPVNGKTKADVDADNKGKLMENADIGAKILDAIAGFSGRLDAIETKIAATPVQNADIGKPGKRPYTGPASTFTRADEAGSRIDNADVEAEVQRIAALPPDQQAFAVLKLGIQDPAFVNRAR